MASLIFKNRVSAARVTEDRVGRPQAACPGDTRVTVTEREGQGTQGDLGELPPGEGPAPLGAPGAGRGGTRQDERGPGDRGSEARTRVGGSPVASAV